MSSRVHAWCWRSVAGCFLLASSRRAHLHSCPKCWHPFLHISNLKPHCCRQPWFTPTPCTICLSVQHCINYQSNYSNLLAKRIFRPVLLPCDISSGNNKSMASLSKQYHYEYDIAMSCGGCSGAIDRVLKRLQGRNSSVLHSILLSPLDVSLFFLCHLYNQQQNATTSVTNLGSYKI